MFCVLVGSEKSGQKQAILVQKERVLGEKIKEWDHFFNTERAVVKSDQEVIVRKRLKEGFGQKRTKLGKEGFGQNRAKLGKEGFCEKRPILTENVPKNIETNKTTERKKMPDILRGSNSLGGKRANQLKGPESNKN